MLHYPKGDTVFFTSTALLALVGLFVALLWAWTWSGVGASARRVADAHGSARWIGQRGDDAPGVAAHALLSLVWFVTADLVGREAAGLDTLGPCALLLGLLAAMILVAVQSLYLGGMPEWAYPGWMARRYYAAHPQARERELGVGALI